MKIQPITLVLVVFATVLGGFVYFTEVRGSSQPEATEETEGQKLFAFEESQVQSFKVQTQLRSLFFERDSEGNWQMQAPEKVPAEESSVAYLLNLLATTRSERVLTVSRDELKEFAFDQPMATIEVKLDNEETHTLVLGGYNFDRSNIYAQADASTDATADLKVVQVSPEFDNAVNRSLAEWQKSDDAPAPSPTPQSSPPPTPQSPPSTP